MAKIIASLLFTLLALPAYSAWDEQIVNHASKYRSKFNAPYMDTLEGACRQKNYDKKLIRGELFRKKFKNSTLHQSELSYNLVLQKDDRGFKKAPLMLIVPGAFTNLDEDQAIMWMQLFSKRGYHIVLVPNPLGVDFLASAPQFKLGDYLREAISLSELAKATVGELQSKNLLADDIQIFGLSHGAFIASILNYHLAKSDIEISRATLMSAPVNINDSFNHLDNQIREVYTLGLSGSLVGTLYNYIKFCSKEKDDRFSNRERRWIKLITVVQGFQKDIVKSAKAYNELHKLDLIPTSHFKRKRWEKELSFSGFFEKFSPELFELYGSESSSLTYWIEKTRSLGKDNVRVILSDDDIINPLDAPLHEDFLYLRGGGHFGFHHTPWFREFLKLAF